MTEKNKKIENLRKILHRENDKSGYLDLEELVAVRAINGNSNTREQKMYPSPFRPTIHFSLNHLVESHMYGDWSDTKECYIIPFKDLLNENKENFFGGSTVDVFFVGSIVLPKNATILKRQDNEQEKDFREKIEQEIENKGYLVVPGGIWDWAGCGASCNGGELGRLFETLGPYIATAHTNSCFGKSDEITGYLTIDLLSEKLKKEDLSEYAKDTRKSIEKIKRELIKNPDLTIKFEDPDLIATLGKEIKINGLKYRQLYLNVLKKQIEEEKEEYNKRIEKKKREISEFKEKFPGEEPKYHLNELKQLVRIKEIYNNLLIRLKNSLNDWVYNYPK